MARTNAPDARIPVIPAMHFFKEGARSNVVYHLYDPAKHGVWEIVESANGRMQVRRADNESSELTAIQQEQEGKGVFDPASLEDARHRIVTSIVSRRGQQRFRQSLLEAYQGRCAITGCAIADVLEAAHILPYRGPQTHEVSNGLLLRANIHTLFDLDLLKIHPTEMRVELSPSLADSDYASYQR